MLRKPKRLDANDQSECDDNQDLDLFCQLEQALKEDPDASDDDTKYFQNRSKLAEEFPEVFVAHKNVTNEEEEAVNVDQYNEVAQLYRELKEQQELVKKQKAEIAKDKAWIQQEKKSLAKERARVESDHIIAASKLGNAELLELRDKYDTLKRKYKAEKEQWTTEREDLLFRIDELSAELHQLKQKQKSDRPSPKAKSKQEKPKSPQKHADTLPVPINSEPEQFPINSEQAETVDQQIQQTPKSKKVPLKIPELALFETSYHIDFDFLPGPQIKEETKNGHRILTYRDGSRGTVFRNGTLKIKRANMTYIFFANKDVAIEFTDGARAYRYSEIGAIEITLPDGSTIYKFTNGQMERHYSNGDKAVLYPNQQFKMTRANGDYEIKHPNGKVEKCIDNHLVVSLPTDE